MTRVRYVHRRAISRAIEVNRPYLRGDTHADATGSLGFARDDRMRVE